MWSEELFWAPENSTRGEGGVKVLFLILEAIEEGEVDEGVVHEIVEEDLVVCIPASV